MGSCVTRCYQPRTLYAMPRCHTPSASSREATIRRSHLILRTPTCPGTTTRSGYLPAVVMLWRSLPRWLLVRLSHHRLAAHLCCCGGVCCCCGPHPWSAGSGSPFISYASSTSLRGERAVVTGMDARVPSSPSNCTCAAPRLPSPALAAPDPPASASPHARSTSRSGTPPHRAVEIAPQPHAFPDVLRTASSSLLLFPPHWIVTSTSTCAHAASCR